MWEPREYAGWWWAGTDSGSCVVGPYPSRCEAQEVCDRANAKFALDRRKNAALDWALAGGASDDELNAGARVHRATRLRGADGRRPARRTGGSRQWLTHETTTRTGGRRN